MDNVTATEVIPWIGTALWVLAQIAPLTPTPKDDLAVPVLRKIFDVVAGNWGNAKNAPPSDKGNILQ